MRKLYHMHKKVQALLRKKHNFFSVKKLCIKKMNKNGLKKRTKNKRILRKISRRFMEIKQHGKVA